jgi:predicted DNA-binding protein YlxM (UPF0122 family)
MTLQEALKVYSENKTFRIAEISQEVGISRTTIYHYIKKEINMQRVNVFALTLYLYLKHNIEVDELENYKYLFKNFKYPE